MFGVDFSELMVIMLVALLVIGPERLPKVARTLGFLWGRAQRYINGVKADIARDMAIDEYRQLTERVQQEARSAEQAVMQATRSIDQQVQQLNDSVERSVKTVVPAAETAPQPTAVQQQLNWNCTRLRSKVNSRLIDEPR
ncbi:MAG: Sec-independent protein translocase protein TatB [Nitrosomonadales bacterium]